ncbi:hypothetical protein AB0C07_21545 [Actinoplanes missouriensis]|uniref:hypothetical protein n=1 Tax=Actinoplanes missouriensis TaxID=1866 RepID=UPI0034082E1F
MSAKRAVAALLAVAAAVIGVWAAAFPLSFYRDFPFPGRNWVSALGPYNEHLTRDVGGLFLALLVMTVWAIRRPSPAVLRMTGGAWLIFTAEHLVWHALHLDVFPTIDKIGNVVSLGAMLVLSLLLLLPDRPLPASLQSC